MKPQTLKGFRDFLPEEARKRQYLVDKLRQVFELYGYEPLETPTLEYEEILMGKYGEEGDRLIYRFTDHGERKVAMRYDQTIPMARVVAQYQNELVFPFKRYQIQPVWRAENPQAGRFREFLQCDADVVGTYSLLADAEIITLVADTLQALGFSKFTIAVNDRQVFGDIPQPAIAIIDKLKKIGKKGVQEELLTRGFAVSSLDTVASAKPTDMIKKVMAGVAQMHGSSDFLVFEPTLARGLDYYTGLIFEVEVAGYAGGSICGGGRYDNLIGLFAGRDIPAVGFAFGFDRTVEAMENLGLFPADITQPKSVLVAIFDQVLAQASVKITSKLRQKGVDAELYLGENTSLDKQLKYADRKGIPYVVIIGEEEQKKKLVTVKNMKTRKQETVKLDKAIKLIQAASLK